MTDDDDLPKPAGRPGPRILPSPKRVHQVPDLHVVHTAYQCDKCGDSKHSSVVETRIRRNDGAITRRRACTKCGHRWTTYEMKHTDAPGKVTVLAAPAALWRHFG